MVFVGSSYSTLTMQCLILDDILEFFNPTFVLGLALGSICFILLLFQNFNDKTFLEISLFVIFLMVDCFPLSIRGGQYVSYPICCLLGENDLYALHAAHLLHVKFLHVTQMGWFLTPHSSYYLASTLSIWGRFLCHWYRILDLNLGPGE